MRVSCVTGCLRLLVFIKSYAHVFGCPHRHLRHEVLPGCPNNMAARTKLFEIGISQNFINANPKMKEMIRHIRKHKNVERYDYLHFWIHSTEPHVAASRV